MKHSVLIACAMITIAFATVACKRNANEPQNQQCSIEVTKNRIPNWEDISFQLDEIESMYPVGEDPTIPQRKIRHWWRWLVVGLADAAGGVAGTIANGGIAGGVLVGAICSLKTAAALFGENIVTNNNNEIPLLNISEPIYVENRNVYFLDNNLIGCESGYYHNACIIDYYTDNNYTEMEVNSFVSYLENNISTINYPNISDSDLSSIISSNDMDLIIDEITEDSLFSYTDGLYSSLIDDYEEFSIINRYIEFSTNLMTPEDFYSYTIAFMDIINSAYINNTISQMEAEAINGAISIYYYSRHLWNTTVPDPRITKSYLVLDNNDCWHLYRNATTSDMIMILNSNDINIVGIPTFTNESINKLYLYKDLLYLDNSDYIDNLVSQGYIDCPEPVNVETIYNMPCSGNNQPIRRYSVSGIIDTDVAYIDFEDYVDIYM